LGIEWSTNPKLNLLQGDCHPNGSTADTPATGDREGRIMTAQEKHMANAASYKQPDLRIQALLKEYELSRTNADHLEDSIWNTAAILVTGSIAGMALLGGTIPESPGFYDYLLRAAIGALSIILVYWWKSMASVWYFIQNMLYYRIVEIEEELDLYSESYIIYIDKAMRGEEIFERPGVGSMISAMKEQYKPLNVPRTVNRIGWLLIAVWVAFLAAQAVAMLGWL
jgi:hypothetical protein